MLEELKLSEFSNAGLRKRVMESLKNSIDRVNCKIVRSNILIFPGKETEFWGGFHIDLLYKHGIHLIDGEVVVFWDYFSRIDERMSFDAPFPMPKLKKWEMPVLARNFRVFNPEWPLNGKAFKSLNELDIICQELQEFFASSVVKVVADLTSSKDLFEYISDPKSEFNGVWRPTLEFLLREKLFGTSLACNYIASSVKANSNYEKFQFEWIAGNLCK